MCPSIYLGPVQVGRCEHLVVVKARVRDYQAGDQSDLVALSLRAWAPVFASLEQVLGSEIFLRLQPDWRRRQESAVREVLAGSGGRTWVAETERGVVGFVAATLQSEGVGEIQMLAVDPDDQNQGIGTALTGSATAWLRGSGATIAVVETGGDPGHAPARRVYEKAGYTLLPIARYLIAL